MARRRYWVEKVSAVNPISPIVESSRNLIAGSFDGLLLAFLCGGGLILLFGIWAVSGMRRAEAAGGWFELTSAFNYNGLAGATSKGPLRFDPPVNQQARQMDDFAQCVLTGRATPVPGEMGRRDLVIIEAIYASAAAGGKRVEIKV